MAQISGSPDATEIMTRNARLARTVLTWAQDACSHVDEGENSCRNLHDRLESVYQEVRRDGYLGGKKLVSNFAKAVEEFYQVLNGYKTAKLIERLLHHRAFWSSIKAINEDVDMLLKDLGLDPHDWRVVWETDRLNNRLKLEERCQNRTALEHDIQGSDNQLQTLILLKAEREKIKHKNEGEPDLPIETKEAIKAAFNIVMSASPFKSVEEKVPTWFLSAWDIEFKETPIGKGAFGEVFRGTWKKEIKVVIKTLILDQPTMTALGRKDFLAEVEILQTLKGHPNIITFYGACHVSTRPCIVYEDAIHGDLGNYLVVTKNATFWKLFYEAALGLKHLYDHNIAHGDLKLNNILVDKEGTAKLADFGLSRVRSHTNSKNRSSLPNGKLVGGLRWLAPERFNHAANQQSDVYALGMCLIEAFSGDVPYGTLNDNGVIEKIQKGEIPPRPDNKELSDDVWSYIQQMTQKDPDARPRIHDVVEKFKTLADHEYNSAAYDPICGSCYTRNPVDSKFCSQCGSPFGDVTPETSVSASKRARIERHPLQPHRSIKTLVDGLGSSSVEEKESIVQELYRQCKFDTEKQQEIIDNGGLDRLVSIARDTESPACSMYAFGSLRAMGENRLGPPKAAMDELERKIYGAIMPSAIDLATLTTLNSAPDDVHKGAELVQLLVKLGHANRNVGETVTKNLALALGEPSLKESRVVILTALDEVTEDHEDNSGYLQEVDGVCNTLLRVHENGSDNERRLVLVLLDRLTEKWTPSAEQWPAELGARVLVNALQENSEHRELALNVLANIAKVLAVKDLAAYHLVIPTLVEVLNTRSSERQVRAFKTISLLGRYKYNALAFVDANGIQALEHVLTQSEAATAKNVLWSLGQLLQSSPDMNEAVARSEVIITACGEYLESKNDGGSLVLRGVVHNPATIRAMDKAVMWRKLIKSIKRDDPYAEDTVINSIQTLLRLISEPPSEGSASSEARENIASGPHPHYTQIINEQSNRQQEQTQVMDSDSNWEAEAGEKNFREPERIGSQPEEDTPQETRYHVAAKLLKSGVRNGDIMLVEEVLSIRSKAEASNEPQLNLKRVVNTPDELGETPIFWAALGGHFDISCLLIDAGAIVNLPNKLGILPMHRLVERSLKCSSWEEQQSLYKCARVFTLCGGVWDTACDKIVHNAARRIEKGNGSAGLTSPPENRTVGNFYQGFAELCRYWCTRRPDEDDMVDCDVPLEVLRRGRSHVQVYLNDMAASAPRDMSIYHLMCILGANTNIFSTHNAQERTSPRISSNAHVQDLRWETVINDHDPHSNTQSHIIRGWVFPPDEKYDVVNCHFFSSASFFLICIDTEQYADHLEALKDREPQSEPSLDEETASPSAIDFKSSILRHIRMIIATRPAARIHLFATNQDAEGQRLSLVMNDLAVEIRNMKWSYSEAIKRDIHTCGSGADEDAIVHFDTLNHISNELNTWEDSTWVNVSTSSVEPTILPSGTAKDNVIELILKRRGVRMNNHDADVLTEIRNLRNEAVCFQFGKLRTRLQLESTSWSRTLACFDPGMYQSTMDTLRRMGELLHLPHDDAESSDVILDPLKYAKHAYTLVDSPPTTDAVKDAQPGIDDVLLFRRSLIGFTCTPRRSEIELSSSANFVIPALWVLTVDQTKNEDTTSEHEVLQTYMLDFEPPTSFAQHLAVAIESDSLYPVLESKWIGFSHQETEFRIIFRQDSSGYAIQLSAVVGSKPVATQPVRLAMYQAIKTVKNLYPGLWFVKKDGWLATKWAIHDILQDRNAAVDGKRHQETDQKLYVGRVCVLGPSRWGKTSLVKSLAQNYPSLTHQDERTIGLDRVTTSFLRPHHNGLQRHFVTFCDFEGSDEFKSVQEIFFSKRSLFLVCVDLQAYTSAYGQAKLLYSADENDVEMKAYIKAKLVRWIEMIYDKVKHPVCVFVATKKDLLKGNHARIQKMKNHLEKKVQDCFNEVCDIYKSRLTHISLMRSKGSPAAASISDLQRKLKTLESSRDDLKKPRWIETSCANLREVLNAQTEVEQFADELDQHVTLPRMYALALRTIDEWRRSLSHQLNDSIIVRAKDLLEKLSLEVSESGMAILDLLHDVGEIVKFEDLGVHDIEPDVMMEDPQLVVEVCRQVVTHHARSEKITHLNFKQLAFWGNSPIHSRIIRVLAWKEALHHLGIAHPVGKMCAQVDLLVPVYWRRLSHYFGGIEKVKKTHHHDRHVKWVYSFDSGLPASLFREFLVKSCSTHGRQVQHNSVAYKFDDVLFQVRVSKMTKDPNPVLVVEAVGCNEASNGWSRFYQVCGVINSVIDGQWLITSCNAFINPEDPNSETTQVENETIPDFETRMWLPPSLRWWPYNGNGPKP